MKKKTAREPNASKPTPIELIRFCKEIGMDLFGVDFCNRIASIRTPEDYEALVREARSDKADSVEDKLRLALNWWTDIGHIAAGVIEEIRTPGEFERDARLAIRWRRSSKVPIPQCLKDEAELQWEIACDQGAKISVTDALRLTRFKTETGIKEALGEFGCPSKLKGRLTTYAAKQLQWLDKKWVRSQNRKRSIKRRAGKSPRKKST